MVQSLTDYINKNNMFLFCLKYDSTFRLEELKTFRTFYALFGKAFFGHLVIEVTWYGQTKSDRRKRQKRERRRNRNVEQMSSIDFADYIQNEITKSLNAAIKKNFQFLTEDIPVVFIDSYEYEFGDNKESDAINQREVNKLENLLFYQMEDTFSCEDNCQNIVHLFRDEKIPIVSKNEFTIINQGRITLECLIWRDALAATNKTR